MFETAPLSDRDFKMQVRLEAGTKNRQIPQEIADSVSTVFIQRGQTAPVHVSLATHLAQHIHQVAKASRNQTQILRFSTPGSVLADRNMEATLQPLVEEIRREFFGAVSAPFLSYEKAVEWL